MLFERQNVALYDTAKKICQQSTVFVKEGLKIHDFLYSVLLGKHVLISFLFIFVNLFHWLWNRISCWIWRCLYFFYRLSSSKVMDSLMWKNVFHVIYIKKWLNFRPHEPATTTLLVEYLTVWACCTKPGPASWLFLEPPWAPAAFQIFEIP